MCYKSTERETDRIRNSLFSIIASSLGSSEVGLLSLLDTGQQRVQNVRLILSYCVIAARHQNLGQHQKSCSGQSP